MIFPHKQKKFGVESGNNKSTTKRSFLSRMWDFDRGGDLFTQETSFHVLTGSARSTEPSDSGSKSRYSQHYTKGSRNTSKVSAHRHLPLPPLHGSSHASVVASSTSRPYERESLHRNSDVVSNPASVSSKSLQMESTTDAPVLPHSQAMATLFECEDFGEDPPPRYEQFEVLPSQALLLEPPVKAFAPLPRWARVSSLSGIGEPVPTDRSM